MFSACTLFACYVARMWPNSLHTLMTQPSCNEWCFPDLPGGSASSNVGQVLPGEEWETPPTGRQRDKEGEFWFVPLPKTAVTLGPSQAQPGTYKSEVRQNLVRSVLKGAGRVATSYFEKRQLIPTQGSHEEDCLTFRELVFDLWAFSLLGEKYLTVKFLGTNQRKSCN